MRGLDQTPYYPGNFRLDKLDWYKLLAKELIKTVRDERVDLDHFSYKNWVYKAVNKVGKSDFVPAKWQMSLILWRFYTDVMESSLGRVIKKILIKTKTRSLSGIVPVSVFTKGRGCPFNCVYCATAGSEDIPKSYFPDEAAVQRAIRFDFDPFNQTLGRLVMFFLSGHVIDKVDLIIQGGTFSFYDKKYREWFVKRCFDAANSEVVDLIKTGYGQKFKAKDLLEAQKVNEKARSRLIGITVETRPDYINKEELKFLRYLGVTRVELGVQIVDDKILSLVQRGHGVEDIKRATYLLKEYGFKVTYHLMTNLPGSSPKHDYEKLKEVFEKEDFRPDYLKIYPTALVKNSQLLDWYKKGKYKPYSQDKLVPLLIKFKERVVPEYVRIQRLVRDLTKDDQEKVLVDSHLRQRLHQVKVRCRCIRCREVKDAVQRPVVLKVFGYKASGGIEYFLSFVDDKDRLYGLLRLRILKDKHRFDWQGIIREVHVYGQAVEVGGGDSKVQHQGLGIKLIQEAEKIAKWHQVSKLAVISGVGVRNYYRRLGYGLMESYMVKEIG